MPLYIRSNTQSPTVMSGFVFTGSVDLAHRGDDLHYQCVNNDLMIKLMRSGHHWFVPSTARSVGELFCLRGQMGYDETQTISTKPVLSPRGIGSLYEKEYYSNVSRGILIFTSILSGRSFTAPSSRSEHASRHYTYSGELVARSAELPMVPKELLVYGQTITSEWSNTLYWRKIRVDQLNPLAVTVINQFWPTADVNFEKTILLMKGNAYTETVSWNGGIFTRYLSDIDYTKTETEAKISYRMEVTSVVPYYQHYVWTGLVTIPLKSLVATIQPVVGNQYSCQYSDYISFERWVSVATPFTGAMYKKFTSGLAGNQQVYPTLLTTPLPIQLEHEQVYLTRSKIIDSPLLENFRKSVENSWKDIVPSAMFSTVDAFKQAEGSLGTNVLQNLAKIPSISSSFPQIMEGLKILGKITRRDFSLLTIKEILDLATSTVLQANFNWRPYQELISSYLPEIASTLQSLREFKGSVVGYGSYSKKIYNDLSREEVTLLTRTKLVMDASPSGLLSAVLGFDALGLLPKFSNLWDIVPFSFMANWFTGVGEALRRAEYSLLLTGIPAYYVHTYTITSPLTKTELDSIEMSDSGTVGAHLRLYYRDVTSYSPFPKDSRFGFGIPENFPPLGTFGSLLYQLIFG